MRKFILLFCAIIFCATVASAQKGLAVAGFFSDAYSSNPHVTLVNMTGSKLDSYGIRKYKSISVVDEPLADRIAAAVAKDGSASQQKEVKYKGGMIYYGFYSLGGSGSARRYLLFLNRRPVGKEKTTLIYIEGNLTAEQVKKIISQ